MGTGDKKLVCYHTNSKSALDGFSKWLGEPVNCAANFTDRKDWGSIENPWQITNTGDDSWDEWVKADPTNRRLVLGVPLVPDDVADSNAKWRQDGAAGKFDAHWVALAQRLVDAGMGNTVIPLAWEMNGEWFHGNYIGDNTADVAAWVSYWQRAVTAMRSVKGAHFVFAWNVNRGFSSSGMTFDQFYPGDKYVDVIGMDNYDATFDGVKQPTDDQAALEARWNAMYDGFNNVGAVVKFATDHKKPLGFGEWAVEGQGDHDGGIGDNPFFVKKMADIVASRPTFYQAYFDTASGGVDTTLRQNPESAREFKSAFGPGGPAS